MFVLASELKRGMYVNVDGISYVVEHAQHIKPGKGAAFVRATLRSALFGSIYEQDFNLSNRIEVTQGL